MRTAGDVLDRLRQVFGVKSDTELAEVLGKKKNTLSTWRARDTKPFEICEQISIDRGLSLEWLLTGEGQMLRHDLRETHPVEFQQPAGLAISPQRVESLLGVVARLPADEQERVMGELCARAEDAQQLAELKAAVAEIKKCKTERAA